MPPGRHAPSLASRALTSGRLTRSADRTGSLLLLENGERVPIEDIAVGARVRTPSGYQPVTGFLHAEKDRFFHFLRLTTPNARLDVSQHHNIFVNGSETDPLTVRVGDILDTLAGPEPAIASAAAHGTPVVTLTLMSARGR